MTLSEHNLIFDNTTINFLDLLHYYREVPVVTADFDTEWMLDFYRQYVAKNQPVLIKGGCSHFPAVEKWNTDYFR